MTDTGSTAAASAGDGGASAGAQPAADVSETECQERTDRADRGFRVTLDVYSGPFDAMLGMIANRRLDLTEVSLSAITEEFLAYVRGMDFARNMDEASGFVDVASILVEAKSAALLPGTDEGPRDDASMEALRERDLLFARLLQYRAFKQAAADFRARFAANAGRYPHPASIDSAVASILPELALTATPLDLARLAARAIANRPPEEVTTHQLHVPPADLKEQAALVRDRLRALGEGESLTFDELVEDAASQAQVVARFLAVLAFFKQGSLQFKQDGPYEPLHLRWPRGTAGSADGEDDNMTTDISEKDFA
ncbi:segregation/condensation protein A [Bifidobacterium amazonense]|uniref:Segregation and condensation protein A n=1 Tax=Bifidobacterium amazonense TaxID=2809027 RepID=A0ABS9VRQ2_9BIFI|nr:ScpA family protein [Bifidobacterium amazonense]MCH9274782.1 segregation/condensation protein A [Bifidobacterium amazonense]